MKAPCALVGAELPPARRASEPFRIKLGKLRGVESQGMLCSARELEALRRPWRPARARPTRPSARDVRERARARRHAVHAQAHAQPGPRLSVYGVARELSALTGAPLKAPAFPPVAGRTTRKLPVKRRGARPVRPLLRPRRARRRSRKAPTPQWMVDRLARCGQRSVSALVDISNYVMFEFGRPRTSSTSTRSMAARRALGQARASSSSCSTATPSSVDETVGVIADDRAGRVARRHHGRRRDGRVRRRRATSTSRPRSGGPTRSRAARAATTSRPTPAIASSAASTPSHDGRAHRAHHAADPRDLRRRDALGPIDDQIAALPEREPVTLARRARRQGDRHAADRRPMRGRVGAPRPARSTRGTGELDVTPPTLALRPHDRGRPDRGSGRASSATTRLPTAPPLGTLTAKLRGRIAAQRSPLRQRLAALGYQETINFSFVESAGSATSPATPTRSAPLNPIASQHVGDALEPARQPVEALHVNLDRKAAAGARIRARAACSCAMRRRATAPPASPACASRCGSAAWPTAPADRCNGARRAQRSISSTSRAMSRRCWRRAVARFVPRRIRRCIRAAARAIELDGERIGCIGELHPRWRQAYELAGSADALRARRRSAAAARRCRRFAPLPSSSRRGATSRSSSADDVTHAALQDAIDAAAGALVRWRDLFDIYEPAQPARPASPSANAASPSA